MKKQLLLTLTLVALTFVSFGQNVTDRYQIPVEIPSNIDRYKVDYELVDESLIATDNSILNEIDLDRLEHVRLESEDLTFFDRIANVDIIVYSKEKVAARKKASGSPNPLKY